MKKKLFLLSVLTGSFALQAQNHYSFSKSQQTYTALTNATSVNNGQMWSNSDLGPLQTPFAIQLFGASYPYFTFEMGIFTLHSTNNTTISEEVSLIPFGANAVDRNISGSGSSLSPVSYQLTGSTGSRILKMELKNAGLEMEFENQGTVNNYFSYQIWFYEADKSIEYRFGEHNITNPALLNDEGAIFSGFIYEGDAASRMGFVHGAVTTPVYAESANTANPPSYLSAIPTPNTVYRFTPSGSASTDDFMKKKIAVYPNPAKEVVNISFEDMINTDYAVYDIKGQKVLDGKIVTPDTFSIDLSNLKSGVYIIKTGGSTVKFIKK